MRRAKNKFSTRQLAHTPPRRTDGDMMASPVFSRTSCSRFSVRLATSSLKPPLTFGSSKIGRTKRPHHQRCLFVCHILPLLVQDRLASHCRFFDGVRHLHTPQHGDRRTRRSLVPDPATRIGYRLGSGLAEQFWSSAVPMWGFFNSFDALPLHSRNSCALFRSRSPRCATHKFLSSSNLGR
jgi:hypothetical protein